MKNCNKCKLDKADEDFAFRNKKEGTLQPYCRKCRKDIDATIWETSEGFRQRKLENQAKNRLRNRQFVYEWLLEHPCVDCGETDPVVLDFDHQKDKIKGVAKMLASASLEIIIAEIAKCVVRCANCHRRKTAKEFGYFRFLQQDVA